MTFYPTKKVQLTHLQLISFAIAHVVLLIVSPLKKHVGGAIANESTVRLAPTTMTTTNLFISTRSSADIDDENEKIDSWSLKDSRCCCRNLPLWL